MSVTTVELCAVTAGPGRLGQATRITSEGAAEDLAHWLLSPNRDWAVVVISSIDVGTPPVDPDEVARRLDSQAEVYVVASGPLTHRLASLLPSRAAVYGNAVRIYPPGAAWQDDLRVAWLLRGDHVTVDTLARHVGPAARPGSKGSPSADEAAVTGFAVDGVPTRIDDVAGARDLAGYLLDPQRRHPVVVVSAHPSADGPYLDAAVIANDLKGLAPVVVVGADATYGLTDALGDRQLSVFYGAGRVYPVGLTWLADMYRAPLHLCTSRRQAPKVTQSVIEAGLVAAHQAGLLQPPPAAPTDKTVTARVDSINDHHFVVRTNGHQALARTATLAIGIPGDRLLRRNQQLTGRIRETGGLVAEFLPDPIPNDPAARVRAAYPTGTIALARVETVDADQASVLLLPDVRATLAPAAEAPDLRALLSVDDTITVVVSWSDAGCTATLADVDDIETISVGASVLPDGPAWLVLGDLDPEPEPDDEPQPATEPTPTPSSPNGTSTSMATILRQLEVARDAADRFADEAEEAARALAEQTRELKRARSDLRKAQAIIRRLKNPQDPTPVYADPARQLRHEISLTYLARVAEPDRPQWPLPEDYHFGPDFIRSLDTLDGIDRTKVLEVVVDVLTGRASQMSSRSVRPWKETRTGKQQVRHDGAKAYRVNLQNNTPSARRMKYWRHPDSRIELDFVGLHDDGLD